MKRDYDMGTKTGAISRHDELKRRGLNNEKIIADFIASENGIEKKDKLPNEMYDKVNYLCRKYMDRMAHFALDYDFIVDEDAFKTVMICMFEKNPVFHSSFCVNPVKPYWRVCDYNINDVVSVFESDDVEKAADDFHSQYIPVSSNIQFKAALIYHGGKTRVALFWNHMCADGGGFKTFYQDFCRNFNEYVTAGKSPVNFTTGSRSFKEVYKDFSKEDYKAAKRLLANHSAHCKYTLPFTPERESDKPVIVRRHVNSDIFKAACAAAKKIGASVNDLLAAAYIDAIYEITGCPNNEEISISCAVDLRRHIKDLSRIGITNHTTFMKCSVPKRGENKIETLINTAKCNAENKADKFLGLHGLPLLDFAYSSMIYAQAELVVGLFYNNAALSISNMGAVDTKAFALDGHEPTNAYVVGAIKRKPCAAVNISTLGGNLVMTICVKGNEDDRKVIEQTFDHMENYFKLFIEQVNAD